MKLLEQNVRPFDGLDEIKLLSSLIDVKEYLKKHNISYVVKYQSNKGCEPDIPWTIIHVENSISLMFAKDKLWQIYLEENYKGSLLNGIRIGMSLEEALKIDPSLKYNDWNEDFESLDGYRIEDNLDNNTVLSIAVFIKEALDEEVFFKYEW
ncbi:MAG: hypothetical protein ACTTID_02100 [Bacillales bacterium]